MSWFGEALRFVLTLIGGMALLIFSDVRDEAKKAVVEIAALNTRVAVVIERLENHDRRIIVLEESKKNGEY